MRIQHNGSSSLLIPMVFTKSRRPIRVIGALLFFLLISCSTPPPSAPENPQERIQKEQKLGNRLAPRVELSLKTRKDNETTAYLTQIATRLSKSRPEFAGTSVNVFLINDRDRLWRSYSIPGNRIYLSIGLLKSLEFENEVAAAVAFELGHLARHHLLDHLDKPTEKSGEKKSEDAEVKEVPEAAVRRLEVLGLNGLFAFTDDEQVEAAEAAVDILYKAGYDSRGLVSLWNRFLANEEQSPLEKSTLTKLIEGTRRVLAQYAPLRNPIVVSQSFHAIRKRIQKL